jgi:sulfur-carrier protein
VSSYSSQTVSVTIKLFAAYQEAYGQTELALKVAEGTSVAEVGDLVRSPYSILHSLAPITRYAINLDFVEPNVVVQDGDEIVFIPPVSGG